MVKRDPYGQNYYPPIPTRFVQWTRVNLIWQFVRFTILNLKMLGMVRKH